jgi:hypothetical protein
MEVKGALRLVRDHDGAMPRPSLAGQAPGTLPGVALLRGKEKSPGGRWGADRAPPGQYHTGASSSFQVTGR